MSADQQRLNSAIQRISEQSPRLRALLKAHDNKGGKPGSVGVGVSEAEETRICCDGSTSSNANPGSTESDPDGDGAGQDGGLNSDDPALLDNGAGTLSGITDCATGEPICFSGSGFIPPDGWDDIDDPPLDPTYEEGYAWIWGDSSSGSCCTVSPTEEQMLALREPCNVAYFANRSVKRTCIWLANYCGAESVNYLRGCDPEPEDILENGGKWPEDGCTNLAIVNGSIVGSKYDPENDGSYSAPVQELEVCDATSGDRILLRVDTNSTYKSIKSLSGDIDPDTQAGYLYSYDGSRIRQISPSEFRDDTV